MISQLPQSLQTQLFICMVALPPCQKLTPTRCTEINGKIITKTPLFISHFSSNLLYQMALILKEQLVSPEEDLFTSSESASESMSMYFIKEG